MAFELVVPSYETIYSSQTAPFSITTSANGFLSALNTLWTSEQTNSSAIHAVNDTGSVGATATLTVAAGAGVLSNDTDSNNYALTVTDIGAGAGSPSGNIGSSIAGTYGHLTLNSNGSYSYIADNASGIAAGSSATDTFTYRVSDGYGGFATATLTIRVYGAPAATNDTATAFTTPVNPTGNVEANDSGASIKVTAVDSHSTFGSSPQTVLANSTSANNATSVTGLFGTLLIGADGSYKYNVDTTNGSVTSLSGTNSLTDTFSYQITDSLNHTATAKITITIYGPPSASPDTASATEAGGTNNATAGVDPTGTVLTNDSGSTITVTKIEHSPSLDGSATSVAPSSTSTSNGTTLVGPYGTLVIGADGTYKYAVNNNNSTVQALNVGQSLTDIYSYQITDSRGQTATTTLTITIHGADDAPVASTVTTQTGTVGSSITSIVVPPFTDVDNTSSEIKYAATLADGTSLSSIGLSIDPNTGIITGTPSGSGNYIIKVTGTDPSGLSANTSFALALSPAAIADTASAIEAGGTNNGSAGVDPTGTVLSNDKGTSITVSLVEHNNSIDNNAVPVLANSTSTNNGTSLNGIYGTLVIGADGTYKYTVNNNDQTVQALNVNQTLTEVFSYQIKDSSGQTSTTTLTITINGADDAPVASAINNQSAIIGSAITPIAVTAFSDVDLGTGNITYVASGLPAGLTFNSATRKITGTPTVSGNYTITITGTDPQNLSASTSFILAISPDAANEYGAVILGQTLVHNAANGVLVNDSGTSITVTQIELGNIIDTHVSTVQSSSTSATTPTVIVGTYGSLYIGADGSYNYVANSTGVSSGSSATDTFTYKITDASGLTATAKVIITIYGPVTSLEAANDSYTTAENSTLTISAADGLLSNDIAPNNHPITVSGFTVDGVAGTIGQAFAIPNVGSLTINADGSYSFTPVTGFAGSVPNSIIYTAYDSIAGTHATAQLSINVTAEAPDAIDDRANVSENTALTVSAVSGLLSNDYAPDGEQIYITSFNFGGTTANAGLPIAITGVGSLTINANGSYVFTPVDGFAGTIPAITYSIQDTNHQTDTANLTLSMVPSAPVANDDSGSVTENTTFIVAAGSGLLQNDTYPRGETLSITSFTIDGDTHTYTAGQTATISSVGTITINADGSYSFAPAAGFAGSIPAITYTVQDSNHQTDTAILALTMLSQAPSSTNDTGTVKENTTLSVDGAHGLLSNDTHPAGDAQQITSFTVAGDNTVYTAGQTAVIPGVGSLTINADGSYSFVPVNGYNGSIPVASYTATDLNGQTSSASLTLSFEPHRQTELPPHVVPPPPPQAPPPAPPAPPRAEPPAVPVTIVAPPATSAPAYAPPPAALPPSAPAPSGPPADGSYRATIVSGPRGADAILSVAREIPNVSIDLNSDSSGGFKFSLPADAFVHSDASAKIALTATTSTGDALPSWVSFDPNTGTFTGQPPAGFDGTITIRVTAKDDSGREAVQVFPITFSHGGSSAPAPQRGGSLMPSFPDHIKFAQKLMQGRTAFSAQLKAAAAERRVFSHINQKPVSTAIHRDV
jgi:large repetitive protein